MRQITRHKSRAADLGPEVQVDEKLGPGGAPHRYLIMADYARNPESADDGRIIEILFQHGGVPENGINGVTIEALLAICADRLSAFQKGPYPHEQNERALGNINAALHALHERTRERHRRGVEGKEKA